MNPQYSDVFTINCNIMKYLKFLCIWECGFFGDANQIAKHEPECANAPFHHCPICENYSAPFKEMREHLEHFYKEKVLSTRNTLTITLDTNKSAMLLIDQIYVKFYIECNSSIIVVYLPKMCLWSLKI